MHLIPPPFSSRRRELNPAKQVYFFSLQRNAEYELTILPLLDPLLEERAG
jgi:hypothetical protein